MTSRYCNDWPSRRSIVHTLQQLVTTGLNKGTSGNVSVRTDNGMLITPTGVSPHELSEPDIVQMSFHGAVDADQPIPSSEWQMHADVYQAKPEVNAIVHCHSAYATILACARRSIPAMHYLVAAAGGRGVPLADYATFGSKELSLASVQALEKASACLLANHGQLATGADLESALKLAELVKEQAHCYWGTLAIGGPTLLSDHEMDRVAAAFKTYGQQRV
jgi:L-fuculose-phosphate aldolase